MDKEIAENLISELERHSGIIRPDRDLFFNVLLSADVSESSRFYGVLPDNEQLLKESSRYHYLSLRRVLRNKNAKDSQLSKWKSVYETIASELGIFSSDALSRKVRTNRDLMNMMAQCKEPFSLLGKFQTWDYDNSKRKLYSITKPILVIPNVENMKPIYDWEEINTSHKKEIRIFGMFPMQKRIKLDGYFSQ